MKYIKYLLLTILLLPITAFAYSFTCDQGPFAYEDSFECVIKGETNKNYDVISGNLELTSNSFLSCEFVDVENGLRKNNENNNTPTSFDLSGVLSSEDIIKVSCKVATKPSKSQLEQLVIPELKYDISDDNIGEKTEVLRSNSFQLQEYIETPTGDTKPRSTENPNSRAKSISDSNNQLDFTFSSFKTIYSIAVKYEVSTIDLVVIPNNENSTYRIEGNQNLSIGKNVIDVYVTSPDETATTCYTFNINRLKRGEDIYYPEKDSALAELSIEGYPINFEPVIREYTIHLTYNVDNVVVKATAKEDGSVIDISNTSNLHNGSTIDVKVTSQDGSNETIYTIKIVKDAPPKDYRNYIYAGVFIVAIIVVIVIIIITNTKNKSNPLLKKKKEENTNVPPVESAQPVVQPQPQVQEQPVVQPMPEQPVQTPPVQPVVQPVQQVPQTPVQPEGTIPSQQ